ncbi:Uu.00g098630.m01.CDS01 [Anthostomella pinea]|uniref:Uu.00g098630.m01.CDS01 n=1 Tax=Anthostomella pinea TaxID=933095 RepID=A0AAI8YCR4_9PEZI|nr:Uu.00g098630.m01.CDS01 [Anthostomella pinea]
MKRNGERVKNGTYTQFRIAAENRISRHQSLIEDEEDSNRIEALGRRETKQLYRYQNPMKKSSEWHRTEDARRRREVEEHDKNIPSGEVPKLRFLGTAEDNAKNPFPGLGDMPIPSRGWKKAPPRTEPWPPTAPPTADLSNIYPSTDRPENYDYKSEPRLIVQARGRPPTGRIMTKTSTHGGSVHHRTSRGSRAARAPDVEWLGTNPRVIGASPAPAPAGFPSASSARDIEWLGTYARPNITRTSSGTSPAPAPGGSGSGGNSPGDYGLGLVAAFNRGNLDVVGGGGGGGANITRTTFGAGGGGGGGASYGAMSPYTANDYTSGLAGGYGGVAGGSYGAMTPYTGGGGGGGGYSGGGGGYSGGGDDYSGGGGDDSGTPNITRTTFGGM